MQNRRCCSGMNGVPWLSVPALYRGSAARVPEGVAIDGRGVVSRGLFRGDTAVFAGAGRWVLPRWHDAANGSGAVTTRRAARPCRVPVNGFGRRGTGAARMCAAPAQCRPTWQVTRRVSDHGGFFCCWNP